MKETLGCLITIVVFLFILVTAVSFGVSVTNDDARADGRTREQLVERGLAEYVIVDAQTGATEWRWKQ